MRNPKIYFAISSVLLLFSVVAIVAVCYFYQWTYNWDARISNMEQILQQKATTQADTLTVPIHIRDIKEQIYISQLDRMSDWLIAVVTLLFGIVIVVQIATYEARIQKVYDQYDEQKMDNEKHIKDIDKMFRIAETNTLRVQAKILEFQSDYYADKDEFYDAIECANRVLRINFEIQDIDQQNNMSISSVRMTLKKYSNLIARAYSALPNNKSSNLLFMANAESYKEYFSNLYGQVTDDLSKREIKIIIGILERAVKSVATIKKGNDFF
jgi:hypothetical protein